MMDIDSITSSPCTPASYSKSRPLHTMESSDDDSWSFSACATTAADDDLVDDLRAMRHRESEYAVGDYLHRLNVAVSKDAAPSCDFVNDDCRSKMCTWCFSIVDHCHFGKDVVAIAMTQLDRFLDRTSWALTDRSAFQLAAITSLYTSIKIHESQSLAVETMAALSRNVYSEDQIEAMERIMLQSNEWLLNPPTSFSFGYKLAQLVTSMDNRYPFDTLLELTNMQLESAICDYGLCTVLPSHVAVAAVHNAMESIGVDHEHHHTIQRICSMMGIGERIMDDERQPLELIQRVETRLYEGLMGTCSTDVSGATPCSFHTQCESDSKMLRASNEDCKVDTVIRPTSPKSVSAAPNHGTSSFHHRHPQEMVL
mmetsp:Transcript_29767/g.55851  ORF Transcript_29767/g.55851 Transcript_29767/m.55851 type:complete len:369 (-) Transcript_29767:452-1558(-)